MITVTPATADDVDLVVDLLEEVERFYGSTEFDSRAERAAQVNEALFGDTRSAHMLLARDGDEVVGLAAYSFLWPAVSTTRSLFLKELFVREAHRRDGVGAHLMRALADAAARARCSRLEWQTDVGNKGAQSFYAGLGVPVGNKVYYRVAAEDFGRLAAG